MIFNKHAIIRNFNKAATTYDEYALIQRKAADYLFTMIRNNISKQMLVIDAGSGTGYFHELLRKNKIYCPLVQLDISYNMCRISDQYKSSGNYGTTYTINADIDNMPLKNDIADIIFSSLTLQWSLDFQKTILKMKNSLKKEGMIAISTIGQGTLTELQQSFAKKDKLKHINDNFISSVQLQLSLEKAGYKLINIYCQNIIEEHKNLKDILYSIKKIGASYNSNNPKYLGKNYFQDLEHIYQNNFGKNNLLPASWNIIHAVATK